MMEKGNIGLVIENHEMNQTRHKACIFNEDGGFIGSSPECFLFVQDEEQNIDQKHLKIGFEEGFFTISPMNESKVFYNDSFSPMEAGYEVIISLGDTFKIGLLKFRFVDSKEINKELLESKEKLESIPKQDDNIDAINLLPRGKVEADFNEKEGIKELIETKPNYDFIETKQDNSFLMFKENSLELTKENVDKILDKIFKELKQNQKSAFLNNHYANLNIEDLEQIIANVPLIKSTKLINLMALSLISKELYSPIFEEMEDNAFFTYLKAAIGGNLKEQKHLFENLTMRALSSYKEK
ncbi:hypothetical protein [Campylobacter helveticus]|uniref:Type VI secretion system protein n=1 Tax=Campylobacter helveticus TaxID=28898 RepID=A0AAX2UGK9_9BACT|nr:hypothetical protein [Campylobacter helveticus]ARE80296.1 type VI secretion system protein [Campylobacter helveticus]MCR2040339.1 hypothetical protein [Campylobacter helveticus]MCR2055374.1 hypothetical protein [Campylobacter helveticus]MCR2057297.1 hypothetical protein [Campylobacter helveticus]MCR2065066.1 hypothetical protein [Campylobacter helveticus]